VTTLLADLGRRLADRWLGAVLLPGLLFVAAAGCGLVLRHSSGLDAARLGDRLDGLGERLSSRPASVALLLAGTLLAAGAAGLAAQGLAAAVRRLWVARRPHRWVAWRRRRARAARGGGAGGPDRYLPARATRIGDRFRLIDERIDAQYGLSVALVWPRLWLLLPETTRPVIRGAHVRYQDSTELTAWGLLTVLLGLIWWPALPVGAGTVVVGHYRGRRSAEALAELVEAAVDTHQRQLAEAVGVALPQGRITPAVGLQINDILNKRAVPRS
jgi:hypothetical protein